MELPGYNFQANRGNSKWSSQVIIFKQIEGIRNGRLASTEGSYFLQESKQAVARLARNQKNTKNVVKPVAENNEISSADVLPEVLRHSLPPKIFHSPTEDSGSSFTKGSKWVLKPDPNRKGGSRVSADALNPLSAYVSLPQHAYIISAIFAFWAVGSAFAVATAIVFGGATLIFGLAASKLELQNTDDIRTKGKDLVHPKFEMFKERLVPLRTWAEGVSKKWHLEREESMKERPLIKELSRKLGAKTSS
ncbi:hypothetical protein DH2020_022777 [Rehmannia glutinosa]|uniref:Uncharacterized protein n=1 Tax=Rehmannia glutinosa TaxID=99300 RepID=A0ABR0W8K9_REHGL